MSSTNTVRNNYVIGELRAGLSKSNATTIDLDNLKKIENSDVEEIDRLKDEIILVTEKASQEEEEEILHLANQRLLMLEKVALRLLSCSLMEYHDEMRNKVINIYEDNLLSDLKGTLEKMVKN